MLTEVKTKKAQYYVDENNKMQGQCICWYNNGQISAMLFYKDSKLHGEYKRWYSDGKPQIFGAHYNSKVTGQWVCLGANGGFDVRYYKDGIDITHLVKQDVQNIFAITQEEALMLKIKYNINMLKPETYLEALS